MPRRVVKVAVNGYGVIGKRVVDAVLKQEDMKLVGVGDVAYDWRVRIAAKRGIPIYAAVPEKAEDMRKAGIEVAGALSDLLKEVDVVVDCTPARVGARNKELYVKSGVKAVFEGGERHEVAGVSFVAQCNYDESLGRQFTRVVSCNTTALCRVLGAIHKRYGIKKARVVIVRRAVDVWESGRAGIMNTVVPEMGISHHAPDVKTVLHDLDIVSMAAKGSHNLFHIHFAILEPRSRLTKEDVVTALREEPRVVLVKGADGVDGLHAIFELGRDTGRPRGDIYEIPVWEDGVMVLGDEVYMMWATPNESNVVPENIDAIRSLTELESDWRKSVELTDKSLGVVKELY
ncbi:MAG: type II glyceraldehyde-3-phosphate dehydrogenase [Candidatus Nezhaarchaeota archaeon]|nr:type II glyceraldehyde-3-phosphate dehydrogenase [Candidatus Nezhaarchaeota archaeon]